MFKTVPKRQIEPLGLYVEISSMHSKRDPTLNKYMLKGEEIVKTSHHSYLGVEIQEDGKLSKHVENCIKRANRALGFIRRSVGRCQESIKETLYTAMVRPHLDMGHGTLISKRI